MKISSTNPHVYIYIYIYIYIDILPSNCYKHSSMRPYYVE